jgi:hypothetical protein
MRKEDKIIYRVIAISKLSSFSLSNVRFDGKFWLEKMGVESSSNLLTLMLFEEASCNHYFTLITV